MDILFTTIYLLQEHELNPRIYSKQELIMSIFVQNIDHDINMHAKIQYLILIYFCN
jgi:low affinity Fe/Cu permease